VRGDGRVSGDAGARGHGLVAAALVVGASALAASPMVPAVVTGFWATGLLGGALVLLTRRWSPRRGVGEAATLAGLVTLGWLVGAGLLAGAFGRAADAATLCPLASMLPAAALALPRGHREDGVGTVDRAGPGASRPGSSGRLGTTAGMALLGAAAVVAALGVDDGAAGQDLRAQGVVLQVIGSGAPRIEVVNRDPSTARYRLVTTSGRHREERILVLAGHAEAGLQVTVPRRGVVRVDLFSAEVTSAGAHGTSGGTASGPAVPLRSVVLRGTAPAPALGVSNG